MNVRTVGAVHIQNCVIRNFQTNQMVLGSVAQLFVSDTIVFNNGDGIVIGAGTKAVLDRLHVENNVLGLFVRGDLTTGNGATVVIRDSVVSGNESDGISALSAPGQAPAFIIVEHTTSVNNGGTGIVANGPRAIAVINDDTISRNAAGLSAINSGQIFSFGNNKNFNNIGPEGAPTGLFNQM